jgi:cytidylate kinase
MEGRDIGTVVFPEAEVKIYLDATPEERARRRMKDLAARGVAADFAQVLEEMKRRDQRDSTRADSPLRQAPDAIYVDSTGMSEDEVEQALLKIVRERTSNGKEVTN